jgi:hypothetical protein
VQSGKVLLAQAQVLVLVLALVLALVCVCRFSKFGSFSAPSIFQSGGKWRSRQGASKMQDAR